MTKLFDKTWTRRGIAAYSGQFSQFAGVELLTLGDGVERGVRCLEFRTGTGLRFRVMVDRALDIGMCEYKAAPIGWHSPTGFRHPGLHESTDEDGLGWLRSFSGLHVTCGLDHILGAEEEAAEHYQYRLRKRVFSPLHGRIAHTPGRLIGYGESWEGDECTLWAEGLVKQAAVFGENLSLWRRIEARVGSNQVRIRDRVTNEGFSKTPHMMMYHINIGHPVLSEGSRFLAPVRHTRWASHADNLQWQAVGSVTQGAPQDCFEEQVYEHAMQPDPEGVVRMALVNDRFDAGRGLGLGIQVDANQFPHHLQWQNYRSGMYVMGIEPSTHHVLGKKFASDRGELIWLSAGAERAYGVAYDILDGAAEIARYERLIAKAGAPAQEEFPVPTGDWEH